MTNKNKANINIKIESTHCFLVKDGKVLLGIKKRGIG